MVADNHSSSSKRITNDTVRQLVFYHINHGLHKFAFKAAFISHISPPGWLQATINTKLFTTPPYFPAETLHNTQKENFCLINDKAAIVAQQAAILQQH